MNRGFQITKRDLEILEVLHTYRYLDSDQISKLISGSNELLKRRLQKLSMGNFVKRHERLLSRGRRESLVYSLAKHGAEILAWSLGSTLGVAAPIAESSLHLEHELLVSETLLAFREGAEERGLSFRPSCVPLRTSEGTLFEVEVASKRYGVVPDAVFSVGEMIFCLEADRGTMPVIRSDFKQSSIMKKLILYREIFRQGVHREKGLKNFRVLFVTSSERRIEGMLGIVERLGGPSGLFLFTTRDKLKSGDPLSMGWQGKRGEVILG